MASQQRRCRDAVILLQEVVDPADRMAPFMEELIPHTQRHNIEVWWRRRSDTCGRRCRNGYVAFCAFDRISRCARLTAVCEGFDTPFRQPLARNEASEVLQVTAINFLAADVPGEQLRLEVIACENVDDALLDDLFCRLVREMDECR